MKRTLFYNGTILTMEEQLYAEAVLVEDGIISAVGACEELRKKLVDMDEVEKVDLSGRTLMPAFIDAHGHFSGYANSLLQAPLDETVSCEEIQEKIGEFIRKNGVKKGQWVVAKGYDHNMLPGRVHPDRKVLDEAAPDNPLVIQHKSGHVGVFNTAALEALHVTEETPAPEGGMIGKHAGRLTGYMEENAFIQYLQQVPMPSVEALMEAYEKTQKVYASHGITTLQEGMMVEQLLPIYQALLASGMLKLDVVGFVDMQNGEQLLKTFAAHRGKYEKHFKIGGYKIFLDGSPQGRTAWMRTPYEGEEHYCGYGTMPDGAVEEAVKRAVTGGAQLLAHCNGDMACEQYIKAWEKAALEGLTDGEERPVMVHAQLLGADQLERVKKLNIIPTFFVAHVYHWGDVHMANFGVERASKISPANSALEAGILFTFHQDAPVIEPDMLETVWCAVNRRTKQGAQLGKEERISVLEALKAVTIHSAYQYFEEEKKGSIKVGKCADFVVLDQNPLETDAAKLREIQVVATYKDGEPVWFA